MGQDKHVPWGPPIKEWSSWMGCHVPTISALVGLRQEDFERQGSLGYRVKHRLK